MSNLDLNALQLAELDATEVSTIDGGCIGWFCIGHLYEFWDGVKEGFEKGAEAGSNV